MKAGFPCKWFVPVLVCTLVSPILLGATTWRVGSDVNDLPTIQAAVDKAVDGDTVVLSAGTYTGLGNYDVDLLGKAITIQSTEPRDPNIVAGTVIDCLESPGKSHQGFYVVNCDGAVLSGLTITHGQALAGGAVYCQNSTLDLTYCRILDNAALPGDDMDANGGPGGGLYCESSTVRIVGCLLRGNTAGNGIVAWGGSTGMGGSGGGICGLRSRITVATSIITENATGTGGAGGGIYGDQLNIANSLITGNRAGNGYGGGIWCAAGTVRQCTIAGNVAYGTDANSEAGRGAGLFCSADTRVTGSILYGNTPDQLAGYDLGKVTYCNIKTPADSNGLTFEPPVFVQDGKWVNAKDLKTTAGPSDPNAVWVQGDFHLQTTSPLLDAGDPNYAVAAEEKDLDGHARVADAAIDLGAYESRALVALYRFQSPTPEKSFYTISEAEKARVLQKYPDFWTFKGAACYVYSRASEPNLMPVYRFWSGQFLSHFYTINEEEKNRVIKLYPKAWEYDGVAFYAFPDGHQPAGTIPVYRFWSNTLGGHSYTTDEAEKSRLTSLPKAWSYEGIAWYARADAQQGGVEPTAGATAVEYEFSGGASEAVCTLSLKALLDGKEVTIDHPEVGLYRRHRVHEDGCRSGSHEDHSPGASLAKHIPAAYGNDRGRQGCRPDSHHAEQQRHVLGPDGARAFRPRSQHVDVPDDRQRQSARDQ